MNSALNILACVALLLVPLLRPCPCTISMFCECVSPATPEPSEAGQKTPSTDAGAAEMPCAGMMPTVAVSAEADLEAEVPCPASTPCNPEPLAQGVDLEVDYLLLKCTGVSTAPPMTPVVGMLVSEVSGSCLFCPARISRAPPLGLLIAATTILLL